MGDKPHADKMTHCRQTLNLNISCLRLKPKVWSRVAKHKPQYDEGLGVRVPNLHAWLSAMF